jgi:hypothetical protein
MKKTFATPVPFLFKKGCTARNTQIRKIEGCKTNIQIQRENRSWAAAAAGQSNTGRGRRTRGHTAPPRRCIQPHAGGNAPRGRLLGRDDDVQMGGAAARRLASSESSRFFSFSFINNWVADGDSERRRTHGSVGDSSRSWDAVAANSGCCVVRLLLCLPATDAP